VSAPTLLTPDGLARLQAELEMLRTEGRRKAARRIREAKALGDVRESGEYEDAKEYQAFIEGRIRELERLLADVQIIEAAARKETIDLGSRVRLRDADGFEEIWTIVGSAEADPRQGRISNESPVGRALLGRKAGETVEVETPAGTMCLTILEVE